MPAGGARTAGLVGLALVLGAGCRSPSGDTLYPSDPLLAARKPVVGPEAGPTPVLLAVAEPMPPGPPVLLARHRPAPATSPVQAAQPAEGPPLPLPSTAPLFTAQTVGRTPGTVVAIPAARRSPPTYEHAPDYSWLRGILDRHSRPYPVLRYATPADADPHGGRVRLDDDPRLIGFRDGDGLVVEGLLRPNPMKDGQEYPRFRIRDLRPTDGRE